MGLLPEDSCADDVLGALCERELGPFDPTAATHKSAALLAGCLLAILEGRFSDSDLAALSARADEMLAKVR